MKTLLRLLFCLVLSAPLLTSAEELKVGDPAPLFTLKNQDGVDFSLSDRKAKGWTVLYFYPKSGTPGCTKEACAFRDAINKIKALDAEVYGISSDSVADQKAFHTEHKLGFDLLADSEMRVIQEYEAKIPLLGMAKRWTFIIDPELKIRSIEKDVDPAMEAARIADELLGFQHADKK
ncbi:MAG: peroxiredoxin [Deltaproteobacteria bacterium]|nr:peroxiredoxin [Deltaproteobacteria bacterium]